MITEPMQGEGRCVAEPPAQNAGPSAGGGVNAPGLMEAGGLVDTDDRSRL